MDSGQVAANILVMVVTFIFAAFFVASEFALVQSRPSALEELLDSGQGNKKTPHPCVEDGPQPE